MISESIKSTAGKIAAKTKGVAEMRNRLKIGTRKHGVGRALDDSFLTAKVKLSMTDNDAISTLKVNVETRESVVEFRGFIYTYWERDAAVKLATRIVSVRDVVKSIDITRQRPESINKNQGEKIVETSDLIKPIAKVGGLIRILGVGLVILGALAVWAPQVSGMTVSVIVGVVLILGGILRTSFAWIASGWGSLFLRAAVGILTIIAGAYMIMQPEVGSQALAMVLIFYLFADGITSLVFAARLPPAAGGAWALLGAIASIAIGVFMWMQWPVSGELAVGVLIGIKLILDGVMLIGVGSVAKAATSS